MLFIQLVRPPKKFHPFPFEYHQELEVTIHSLTNLGIGVARTILPEAVEIETLPGEESAERRWVIFVPFSLPGERVRIRIYRNDNNCSQADLLSVIEPSPERIEPSCPLFGECGGCQYQHLSYETQLLWKQRQVGELAQRMAGLELEVLPPVPSPRQWGYRSKLTPHFQKPRNEKDSVGPIGFLAQGTRSRLIDVPQCPIAMDSINEALPTVRSETHARANSFKKGGTLLLRAHPKGVETNHRAVISEKVNDLRFHFLAGDFFQNNPFILPHFVDYVAKEASETGNRHLVDAYCGSGLFTLSLARYFDQVAGVEVSDSSADFARRNAELNDLPHVKILTASAEEIFRDIAFPPEDTTVVIDPPRKGCTEGFLTQLNTFQPSRLIYISCNPATQMRDFQQLSESGYQVEKLQPFDLFPQTRHLECVATLTRA